MTVVLDGGLATELEARGHDLSDRLWSARLLLTAPAEIEAVHRAYFAAGAQVATTASYQATIEGFAAAGHDRATALAAMGTSVEVARRARDAHAAANGLDPDGLLVAGSCGPYGAMLADGSEYRGDHDPGEAALRDLHAPRMEALLDAGADLLALETVPTVREARVMVALLDELGATGWLSVQCRDDAHTAAGEPITEVADVARDAAGLIAIGVNCTSPRSVPALLDALGAATDLPLVAYPNGGDRWDAEGRRWVADDGGRAFDADVVASWTDRGAGWLGGCCGTGPADIAALAGRTNAAPA